MKHFLDLDITLLDHSDGRGYTALHHAALSGFEDTVDFLLCKGADVNARSLKHVTPLHLAAIKGRANVVDLLLENRAVVDHPSEALGIPLHCAAFSGNGSTVNALTRKDAMLEASAEVSMWEACAKVSMWEMYAASGISPNNAANHDDSASVYQCQPFIVALIMQTRDIVGQCMGCIVCREQEFPLSVTRQSSGSVVARTASGATPLMLCARDGLVFFCEELLRVKASCTTTNSWGWNALTHAAYMGHTACIRVLLDRSGDDGRRSADHRDNQGWTPLMYAAQNCHVDSVQELLQRGVFVDQPAGGPGNSTTAECFFGNTWDFDWDWRQRGLTALHIAAYHGHVEVVRQRAAAGASWRTRTEEGITPVKAARGNRDILDFSLRATSPCTLPGARILTDCLQGRDGRRRKSMP